MPKEQNETEAELEATIRQADRAHGRRHEDSVEYLRVEAWHSPVGANCAMMTFTPNELVGCH